MTSQTAGSERMRALRCTWGLALIISGQPVAWALRGALGLGTSEAFPAIPVLLGLLLLVQPKWMFGARLYSSTMNVAIPTLLLLFPFAVLSLVDTQELMSQIVYMLILCMLAILVALNPADAFRNLPMAVMTVGFCGCIVSIAQLASGGVLVGGARLALTGNANTLIVAFNGAVTALAAMVVGVTSGRDRLWVGAFAALVFCLGVSNVLLTFTRSAMIFLTICIPLYLIYLRRFVDTGQTAPHEGRKRRLAFWGILVGSLITAPVILEAVIGAEFFTKMTTYGFDRLLAGLSVLGISSGGAPEGGSLSMHSNVLKYNWENWGFWGHGVMAQSRAQGTGIYAHLAYLQGLYDLGLLGGLLYFVVAALIPAALIFLRLKDRALTPTDVLLVLLYVYEQGDQLMHDVPYTWQPALFTVLIYVLLARPREGRALPDKVSGTVLSAAE